jgi:16S rRNA (adenine1518-N6/adenine1519-N6)-dimethyltransferase
MGLRTELGGDAKLELAHADFMEYDLGGLSDVLVLGNLPYCVSSQMLFRLFDWVQAWRRAVLTTQREFAARVLAEPGTKGYGALTVFFERLATRERLFNVPARRFKPVPDVVSTAFRLVRRERPLYPVADEQVFRRVVKACFCQRRKTLANNLVAGLGISKPAAVELARAAGVSPDCRAETLTGEMFAGLAETAGGEVRTMNSERRTP